MMIMKKMRRKTGIIWKIRLGERNKNPMKSILIPSAQYYLPTTIYRDMPRVKTTEEKTTRARRQFRQLGKHYRYKLVIRFSFLLNNQ